MNVSSSRPHVSRPIIITVSLFMLMVAAFFVPSWLASVSAPSSTSTVAIKNHCSLNQQTCQYQGYQATLADPLVQPLHANTLTVITPKPLTTDALLIKLKGVEMNMGEYRLALKQTGEQTYQGELMLPVCTEDSMTWVGSITLGNEAKNHFPIKVRMER